MARGTKKVEAAEGEEVTLAQAKAEEAKLPKEPKAKKEKVESTGGKSRWKEDKFAELFPAIGAEQTYESLLAAYETKMEVKWALTRYRSPVLHTATAIAVEFVPDRNSYVRVEPTAEFEAERAYWASLNVPVEREKKVKEDGITAAAEGEEEFAEGEEAEAEAA